MNTKPIVQVILYLAIWIAMVPTNPLAYACTAFMKTDGEVVLVGNNEDSKIPYTRVSDIGHTSLVSVFSHCMKK